MRLFHSDYIRGETLSGIKSPMLERIPRRRCDAAKRIRRIRQPGEIEDLTAAKRIRRIRQPGEIGDLTAAKGIRRIPLLAHVLDRLVEILE
jgi:hypothetical protein